MEEILSAVLAGLAQVNPAYAAIGALVLFLVHKRFPNLPLPKLPDFGPKPSDAKNPLLDWLLDRLKDKFKDLKTQGLDDHEAVLHLLGTIKSAGVKVDK